MSFRFEKVGFRYPQEPTAALSEIDLEIPEGQVTAVLGLSGSGKSTALAAMSLLQAPAEIHPDTKYTGRIEYRDSSAATWHYPKLNEADCKQLRLREFGIVLQRPYLLPHFNCADNVAMPLALAGVEESHRREVAKQLLAATGLDHLAERQARQLSGGERQRMAVLRAIVHNPHVVFADEPVSSLDYLNAEVVLELLAQWQRGETRSVASPLASGTGTTVASPPAAEPPLAAMPASGPHLPAPNAKTLILVTHSIQSAWQLAEHFVVLHHGKLVGGRVQSRQDVGEPARLSEMIERGVQ